MLVGNTFSKSWLNYGIILEVQKLEDEQHKEHLARDARLSIVLKLVPFVSNQIGTPKRLAMVVKVNQTK